MTLFPVRLDLQHHCSYQFSTWFKSEQTVTNFLPEHLEAHEHKCVKGDSQEPSVAWLAAWEPEHGWLLLWSMPPQAQATARALAAPFVLALVLRRFLQTRGNPGCL